MCEKKGGYVFSLDLKADKVTQSSTVYLQYTPSKPHRRKSRLRRHPPSSGIIRIVLLRIESGARNVSHTVGADERSHADQACTLHGRRTTLHGLTTLTASSRERLWNGTVSVRLSVFET